MKTEINIFLKFELKHFSSIYLSSKYKYLLSIHETQITHTVDLELTFIFLEYNLLVTKVQTYSCLKVSEFVCYFTLQKLSSKSRCLNVTVIQ